MKREHRPKIMIEKDLSDKLMDVVGLIACILIVALPIYYFEQLPDTIPSHYNFKGEVDGYSDKAMIWGLVILAVVMYIGIRISYKYPHTFNYLQKITEENAERQYRLALKMMRLVNTIVVIMFLYMVFEIIQGALGNKMTMSLYIILGHVALLMFITFYYLYQSSKK